MRAEDLEEGGNLWTRIFLPSVMIAMQQWASKEFVDEFFGSIPAPLRMLYTNYYLPDYETCVRPMRDAPLLDSKPSLSKEKCREISFGYDGVNCMSSIFDMFCHGVDEYRVRFRTLREWRPRNDRTILSA